MPLVSLLVKALGIALGWVARSMVPWLWRTVIVGGLRFVWQKMIYPVAQVFIAFFAFLGRNIISVFVFIAVKFKEAIIIFFTLSLKTRLLLLLITLLKFGMFFKWAFLMLFAVVVYKVLEVFGINILVEIVRYLLLAFSYVIDILLTLIFGMIDFDAILNNFNEYFNALPSCAIEMMFAVGLSEALNSVISTCVLVITIRFAMLIIRR